MRTVIAGPEMARELSKARKQTNHRHSHLASGLTPDVRVFLAALDMALTERSVLECPGGP
jgi:hypothetical protein